MLSPTLCALHYPVARLPLSPQASNETSCVIETTSEHFRAIDFEDSTALESCERGRISVRDAWRPILRRVDPQQLLNCFLFRPVLLLSIVGLSAGQPVYCFSQR